jgi:very-short-patch-repair endonuclease
MKFAWAPLANDMGWTPTGSPHEPEPDFLVKSRKRGRVDVKWSGYWPPNRLDAIAMDIEEIEQFCESPIERQFGTAAAAVFGRVGLRVVPQYELSGYRYDFAIRHLRFERPLALIECDGKEFHSTAEQLDNDHKKHVAAGEIGIFVIRYSGAAIVRDAKDCAEDALRKFSLAYSKILFGPG